MAEVGSYYVTIMPDVSKFSDNIVTELNGAAAKTSEVGDKAGEGFAQRFGAAASVFLGNVMTQVANTAVQTLMNGISGGIERLDTMAVFPKIMANMGIAAEDSEEAIQRVSQAIVGLPTALDDAARSVQRLTMSTGDIDRATDVFIAFNNALISGGAPTQLQASALEQFTQAVNKGKPDMLEWRTLMNAMPAQLSQIALSMGMTAAELGTGLRTAEIPMQDFLDAIVRLNTEGVGEYGSFTEQVKAMTGTVQVAMANMRNRIEKFWQEIFEAIGQQSIADAINGITMQLPTWGQEIGSFVQDVIWDVDDLITQFAELSETTGALGFLRDAWDELAEHIDGQEIRGFIRIAADNIADGLNFWGIAGETVFGGLLSALGWFMDEATGPTGLPDYHTPWVESQPWYGGSTQLEDGRTMITVLSAEQINANREAMELWAASTDESWKDVQERVVLVYEDVSTAMDELIGLGDIYQQNAAMTDESWKYVQQSFEDTKLSFGDMATEIGNRNANMLATIDESWKSMQENQVEATSTMKNTALEAMDSAMERTSKLGAAFTDMFAAAESNGTMAADTLKSSFTSAGSAIGDTIADIQKKIDALHGKTVDINVVKSGVSRIGIDGTLQGGGISIWAAAAGGIATRATFGVFGEAGDEAIIPLSNRDKVRPFARAVAAEMGGGTVNNYYIDGNLVAADAVLASALETVAERVSGRRRMGVA